MSEAHRRPKAPDEVRGRLIAAAARLLNEGEPLSLNAVARDAGVTKGAVQHHFGTGEGLRGALYDTCMEAFESAMAPARATSTEAAAYAEATLADGCAGMAPEWRALLAAMVSDRALAVRWSDWIAASRRTNGAESTDQLVARLAMDGLWLSDILGLYRLDAAERAALRLRVLELAQRDAA